MPAGAENADAEHSDALRKPAEALDMACGRAGNGEWLARRGFHVSAWDISDVIIDDIRRRKPQWIACADVRDVTQYPPAPASFDIIVVCRFLDRSLCPAIANALLPGGTLFYQTFTQGLSNPDFMLNPGELPQLFPDLQILEYHEPGPDGSGKAEARLVARRV
jgi:2-polyprenyl-3-methyl-5-hydroxy-6-metoxy-1,4-benzoquinol methylase